MGNSLGCSASGERLVSAARDGDVVEARMLLDINPCLARYSTFGGLNSPLHFAAAKGHSEIVTLLLENGAEVNSRNYCGQTALMQACRYGHWEVVQILLLYRSNVTRTDYLSGRTALHFAAVEGHARCIRLLVADFVPSVPFDSFVASVDVERGSSKGNSPDSLAFQKNPRTALARFVNKTADGGITALHMAALNGYADCVLLLLDLHADFSVVTIHYGSSMNLIGAGSTPLHFAACGGNLKCCQILISRGASCLTLNCNGWLPLDVARAWKRHSLEPLLSPNSEITIPNFPPSGYLALPLMSILNIARDCGLIPSAATSEENDLCAVCLESVCSVAAGGCGHEFCVKCALHLCSTSITPETTAPPGSIPCPLCRNGIIYFVKLPSAQVKEMKLSLALSLCNPCILPPRDPDLPLPTTTCRSHLHRSCTLPASTEIVCPLTCTPFPSISMASCVCDDEPPCLIDESQRPTAAPESSPARRSGCARGAWRSGSSPGELASAEEGQRLDRTTCSNMFWNRLSSHREQQCNSEMMNT